MWRDRRWIKGVGRAALCPIFLTGTDQLFVYGSLTLSARQIGISIQNAQASVVRWKLVLTESTWRSVWAERLPSRQPHCRRQRLCCLTSVRKTIRRRPGPEQMSCNTANRHSARCLLSAIELALTGGVQFLRRADPVYDAQLLHRGTKGGSVEVKTSLPHVGEFKQQFSSSGISIGRALDHATAAFFAERAYLPQSYLGQLLQIYQESASDANSPLAKFVGSLLGLDQLDALEAGLTPLTDVRNVRKYIEGWSDVELEKKQLDGLIKTQKQTQTQVQASLNKPIASLSSALQGLNIAIVPTAKTLDEVADIPAGSVEEGLATYADRRRELAAILSESQTASEGGLSATEASLAAKQNRASEDYKAWQATYAARFQSIQSSLAALIPDVSLPSAMDEYATRVQTILSSILSTASQQVLEAGATFGV